MARIMVCKASEIPQGRMQKFSVGGKEILVANVDGKFFATGDTCTHSGASLSEGSLEGNIVTCGWHGAKFDCKTGRVAEFPVSLGELGTYRVTVESGEIFVEA